MITERAVQKHVTSIFLKLNLQQSDDDHRRILAVLAYMRPRELTRRRCAYSLMSELWFSGPAS